MRSLTKVALVATLIAGVLPAGAAPASAASGVSVSVNCYSSPERVTIRNNRHSSITVQTVGSIYKPYSSEPYGAYRTLKPGKSLTWSAPRSIFNNDVGTREGVRVRTSVGTFTDRC